MKLMCMSFDGDYQVEHPTFNDSNRAWQYANDIGSKWYFYPFYFLVSDSEKTIVDAPMNIKGLIGKRVKTVKRLFSRLAAKEENQGKGVDAFLYEVHAAIRGGD